MTKLSTSTIRIFNSYYLKLSIITAILLINFLQDSMPTVIFFGLFIIGATFYKLYAYIKEAKLQKAFALSAAIVFVLIAFAFQFQILAFLFWAIFFVPAFVVLILVKSCVKGSITNNPVASTTAAIIGVFFSVFLYFNNFLAKPCLDFGCVGYGVLFLNVVIGIAALLAILVLFFKKRFLK